jgi:tRNA pseudouridine55 synthase
VYLHAARWVEQDLPRRSVLEITCRGGFYVRSLARELGRLLGCGAHLARLGRTAIGPWQDPGLDQEVLLEGDALIPWCPARVLTAAEADQLLHGRPIELSGLLAPNWSLPEGFPDPGAPVRALFENRLVALLKEKEGAFWTSANLRGGL